MALPPRVSAEWRWRERSGRRSFSQAIMTFDSFDLIGRALEAAASHEADAVFIATDRNISRFANSTVHQNMSEISGELTLRVVTEGKMGTATTTSFDPDEIARTADLAREGARRSDPVPNFSGLDRPTGSADQTPASATAGSFDEPTATVSPRDKALDLRAMFDFGLQSDVHFAGSYSTASIEVACGNTHGVRRLARITSADATVIATRAELSGYATGCSRSVGSLDLGALGREATMKATLAANEEAPLEPGLWDVVLEPPAISEVLEWLNMIAFTGQSYEDGSSLLVGNLGKQIFSPLLTISDDATDSGFLPFPFDLEGQPKRSVTVIDRGIGVTPLLDKAYSDRLQLPATASASSLGGSEHGGALHLSVAPGHSSVEAMIRSTERGVWVTRFNYVNGLLEPKTALMTGTTRDGTFLIRDGRLAGRLPNLRWTQSIREGFSSIESLSAGRRRVGTWWNRLGGTISPAIKIRDWNFTGVQKR
jgi:PmbA protein